MSNRRWTRTQIVAILKTRDDAVDRAMLRIWQLQTKDEQKTDATKHRNNVGFNATDAKKGSYYARWVKSGRKLSGHYLDHARRMAIKYSRQLTDIANGKITV